MTELDAALADLDALGEWPGDERYLWAINPLRLRAAVLDAVAATCDDARTAERARIAADDALRAGRCERVPDPPERMPAYADQTPGVGWWQWFPKDVWHYGPDEPHWPGPATAVEAEWLAQHNQISRRWVEAVPFGRRRRIVPLPELGVGNDPRDETDADDVIAAGELMRRFAEPAPGTRPESPDWAATSTRLA